MTKTIFIDWDDTLVHNRSTVQAFKDANQYNTILAEAGLIAPKCLDDIILFVEEEYERLNSMEKTKKGKFYEILCSKLGFQVSSTEIYLFLDDLYNEKYAQMTNFMQGAERFLNNLDNKFQLIIISDGYTNRVNAQLKHLGLEKRFAETFFSDKYGFKFEGNIFDKARKMHFGKRDPLFIGDDPSIDILAIQYDFEVLLVNNGYSDYSKLPSDVRIATFDQISRKLHR